MQICLVRLLPVLFLRSAFDNSGHALGRFGGRGGDYIVDGQELEEAVHAGLEEVDVEVLGAAGQKEVEFDPVAFREPFTSLLCLEGEVVVASTKLDLYVLNFDRMSLGLGLLLLLVLGIHVLAKVGNFCDGRSGACRDLDKVEAELLSLL